MTLRRPGPLRAGRLRCLVLVGALALTAGCAFGGARADVRQVAVESPLLVAQAGSSSLSARVPAVGPLRGDLLTADLLVVGDRPLPRSLQARIRRLDGVREAMAFSLAVSGRSITVGAVDPSTYRRFTPPATARMTAVWQRVVSGDVALAEPVASGLRVPLGGTVGLGSQPNPLQIRVGAFASMAPRIDAVVNVSRGEQLGMRPANAVLVSTEPAISNAAMAATIERVVRARGTVQSLTATSPSTATQQTAYLIGGSVADAVGTFTYRYFPDGSVEPDARWVTANIRTESVPILGEVTCHRVMLPQLRAALAEVESRGLASAIDTSDYGGCYVPRFIERNPARGLSLHTWGIALDLNVAGNQRGTVGLIDRTVVAIFKKWGFAWGGDWQWTDPMHFELAALVEPR
jgi:hypothetical protein